VNRNNVNRPAELARQTGLRDSKNSSKYATADDTGKYNKENNELNEKQTKSTASVYYSDRPEIHLEENEVSKTQVMEGRSSAYQSKSYQSSAALGRQQPGARYRFAPTLK